MPRKVYKSIYTGRVWNTKAEAVADSKAYFNDVGYRFETKHRNLVKNFGPKIHKIPFIKSKKITLSNAGLATGGVLSTNLLDSIADGAVRAGIPIKTAIGIATKESTLGNPTDDRSVYKILNSENRKMYKELGTGQHINKGLELDPRSVINSYRHIDTPYSDAINYAYKKAMINGKLNDKLYNKYLRDGEKYADNQVNKYKQKYQGKTYFQAAFEDYKSNPNSYNPGQSNYPRLVEKRGNEVWNSPEVQTWYKEYSKRRRSLEEE